MHSHNTLTPWHPWLRPIARLLIGTLLCHALLPLSALAQQGAVPVSPTDQAQIQRLRPPQQRDGPGQSARTRRPAPASERIARNLALAHSLVRPLPNPPGPPGPCPTASCARSQSRWLHRAPAPSPSRVPLGKPANSSNCARSCKPLTPTPTWRWPNSTPAAPT